MPASFVKLDQFDLLRYREVQDKKQNRTVLFAELEFLINVLKIDGDHTFYYRAIHYNWKKFNFVK